MKKVLLVDGQNRKINVIRCQS